MRKTWIVLAAIAGLPLAYAALPFDSLVKKHAAKYGFDPLFIHAVIEQESRHNPKICSHVGACGLMQIMPGTAGDLEITVQQRFDPDKNVAAGTLYLKRLHNMFGNTPDSLRAYNWGMGNMRKYLRRKRNGQNPKMPKEAFEYAPKIAWHYYNYGGKGNMFQGLTPMSPNGKWQNNGGKSTAQSTNKDNQHNPNRSKTEDELRGTVKTCPKPDIPEPPPLDGQLMPMQLPAPSGGSGKVVFDPAKIAQWAAAVAESQKQLKILKGEYNALTKGMAGLELLQNVATLSGYEIPNIYEQGQQGIPEWGKAFDGNLYQQLVEMKAADTGIYANGQLKGNVYAHVQSINHSYAESEIAWAKVNCAISNLEVLTVAAGKTKSVKQAKDVQNAIDLETALLAANQAKIRANIVAMQSRYKSLKLTANQEYIHYLDGKKSGQK